MTFKVVLFIEGVGNYVPHVDDKKLLVLFPEQGSESAPKLRSPLTEEPICQHRVGVQFYAQALNPAYPNTLLTLDAEKHWISISAEGAKPLALNGGKIPGLLQLSEVLSAAGLGENDQLKSAATPGQDFDPSLLRGGLYLDQGTVQSHPERTSERQLFGRGRQQNIDASNTMMVSFGDNITHCKITFKPFDGGEARSFQLETGNFGEIKIWVRHSCDLSRHPERDLDYSIPEGEEERKIALTDEDFVLNYLLLDRYSDLLANTDNGKNLPMPQADPSFEGGGNMDIPYHKCQPGGSGPTTFWNPMRSPGEPI